MLVLGCQISVSLTRTTLKVKWSGNNIEKKKFKIPSAVDDCRHPLSREPPPLENGERRAPPPPVHFCGWPRLPLAKATMMMNHWWAWVKMVGIFLMMLVFVWFFIFPTWHHKYTTRARTSSRFSRFAVDIASHILPLNFFYIFSQVYLLSYLLAFGTVTVDIVVF